jgi:3-dehydroquinate synthase
MGEVIKHGMILDEQYYHMIRENRERIFQMDVETLKKIIRRSCELKTQIVSEDEKESGLREILNFGHTIGHAVERLYNFELLHGECIAVGMVAAAYISYQRGLLTKQQLNELEELLEQYQLPTRIQSLKDDQIYHQLFLDKKVKNNQLSFVLLSKIGEVFRTNTVEKEEIFSAISYIIKRA